MRSVFELSIGRFIFNFLSSYNLKFKKMKKTNYYSYRKHYVFVFYKNGAHKVFKFSMSSSKKVSERRKKFFDFLPYDVTIKKFYVISGVDQTQGFSQKLCRELNI